MASAAILVGGEARRFGGRDKSQILIDGRTILARQLSALAPLTDDVLLIGARRPALSPDAVRCVCDVTPGLGPMGGLQAALAAARDEHVLLLACDMPFVTTALLQHLIERAPSADVVVPVTARGFHPLCAVYARRCQAEVNRLLAADRRALRDLLGEVRVDTVEPQALARFGDAERLLANLNAPADLDDLRPQQGHKL